MNPEKGNIKSRKYFDPKFKPDIVPEQRGRVMRNIHKRYAPHMLSYYYSKRERIKTWTPELFKEIEYLLKSPKTTLHGKDRVSEELWNTYWSLIEQSGEALDEFGMVKEKIDFEQKLKEIEENYSHLDWNTLFKLDRELFGDGTNNIVVGGMGTGKSNLMLSLSLACMKNNNTYELVTNLGMKDGYEFDDIHHVSWMSDLLKIICENKIRNIELEKNGKKHLQKTIIFIIDEAENLFQSIRSGSKEIADWNLIVNMFRKLQVSATYIFHRYRDVPAQIRNSPNINAIIFKGCDMEGNPINESLDRTTIYFPKYNGSVKIRGIPKCDLLDSNEYSSFAINEEEFPEKSVNIKYILRLASDYRSDLAPKIILNYLDKVKIENISNEELLKEVKRISELNKEYMIICDTKTDYYQWVQKQFEEAFSIEDVTKLKAVTQTIKRVVNEDWSITKIERNIKQIHEGSIDFKKVSLNELFKYLQSAKTRELKEQVEIRGYREFVYEEYLQLESFGISKTKLKTIYGHIKPIMQIKT